MDWIIIGGLLIIIVTQILLRPKQLNNNKEDLEKLLNEIQRSFDRIEKNFREDFRLNREESRLVAKDNREELARSMNEFKEAFERGIDSFNRLQKEKFAALHSGFTRLAFHHDTSTTSKFVPDLFAPRSAADRTHFVDFDKMVGKIFEL